MKEQTPNREDGPEKKREKTNEEQTNEGGEVSTCGFIPFSSRPSLSITYNLKRLFIRCVFEREAIIFSIQREGEEESIKWGRTRKLQSWSSGPWSGRRLISPAQKNCSVSCSASALAHQHQASGLRPKILAPHLSSLCWNLALVSMSAELRSWGCTGWAESCC